MSMSYFLSPLLEASLAAASPALTAVADTGCDDHCNAVLHGSSAYTPQPSSVGLELGSAVDSEHSKFQPNILRHP